ncbi:transposase, IS4, partial [Pseudomonas syringae pv. actinidiae ICMP 18804]
HWPKLREILLHESIYNKRDLRTTVEGMLYRMRVGCPWRDLPKAFGNWSKVYKRFNAWSASGKWVKVLEVIGKSRAGNTSKIHLAVDACGLPIAFDLTGGQTNDCSQAASLIAKVPDAEVIIADKGYDTEAIRAQVEQQGSKVVIPRKRNSLKGNADLDKGLYRNRHLVENAFARLKHFRAVASRFDKLKRNYESVIAMACAFLWLPM